jgi:hypothetical protein
MRRLRYLLAQGIVAIGLVLVVCGTVRASEFGVSTYRPGLMDLYPGILPPPGNAIVKELFLYQDARENVVSEDGRVEINTHTICYTDAVFAAYVTRVSVLGAYWAFGTIQMLRISSQSLGAGPRGGPVKNQTSTVGGLGDGIFVPAMLNWNFGQFHLTGAFTFYAPTGSYVPQRIINVGVNRWAIEPDLGLTWLDRSGREFSLFVGYTINTKNPADDYYSGQEFHADFALVQHLANGFVFGMAGYALQQTTPDSGSGAKLGPFMGRVIGLGPMVGQTLAAYEIPVHLTVKYDFEFAEQNRSSGNELWLTATVHF